MRPPWRNNENASIVTAGEALPPFSGPELVLEAGNPSKRPPMTTLRASAFPGSPIQGRADAFPRIPSRGGDTQIDRELVLAIMIAFTMTRAMFHVSRLAVRVGIAQKD